ncbi:uncharacterized protein BDV14DRAFT_176602 [Aspergillus stella-maris]|uniref:uncharacterized protein n=1 Tax=Aspergillus stella-maris TaxID=1810926 RepID=UPI003CCD3AED
MKSSQNSTTPHAGSGHATGTSNTYGTGGGVSHTPATASNSTHTDYATGTSNSTRNGENVGSGVKGAAAEIHGMGEALRGGMGAAVDRAFGHEEGVARNDVIAQKGDREMRSGNFH